MMPICTESFSRIIPPGSDWHCDTTKSGIFMATSVAFLGKKYPVWENRAGMTKRASK